MNKKIFAALASATMALSATGSLAVFAEDFDVVTEADGTNSTPGGENVPDESDALVINAENFPDKQFRTDLVKYLNEYLNTTLTANDDGDIELTKDQVKSVKTICVGDFSTWPTTVAGIPASEINDVAGSAVTAADWGSKVKDVTGLNKFTSLENLYIYKASALTGVDASENSKLINFAVAGSSKVANIGLPKGNILNSVSVTGPILTTELDLSANKGLSTVNVTGTEIAAIDLSSNPYLNTVNVPNNKINTLNLANSLKIAKLDAHHNDLYGIELPAPAPALTDIDLSENILQNVDLPTLTGVTALNLSDNELSNLDLSNVTFAATSTLNVDKNHLGALKVDSEPSTLTAGTQNLFLSPEYNAINLEDNFADFDDSKATVTAPSGTKAPTIDSKTGVLSVIPADGATYTYTVVTGTTMTVNVVRADVLNRLYNPNSGEHFYTKDIEEKDVLVGLGWKDEGIAWTSPKYSDVPVYRLYNPNAGDHHYTKNPEEKNTLVAIGWKYEGVGWYSYDQDSSEVIDPATGATFGTMPEFVTVYRQYNPNAKAAGAHNYTVNEAENDFLVSVGWLEEGTAWSAIK